MANGFGPEHGQEGCLEASNNELFRTIPNKTWTLCSHYKETVWLHNNTNTKKAPVVSLPPSKTKGKKPMTLTRKTIRPKRCKRVYAFFWNCLRSNPQKAKIHKQFIFLRTNRFEGVFLKHQITKALNQTVVLRASFFAPNLVSRKSFQHILSQSS